MYEIIKEFKKRNVPLHELLMLYPLLLSAHTFASLGLYQPSHSQ